MSSPRLWRGSEISWPDSWDLARVLLFRSKNKKAADISMHDKESSLKCLKVGPNSSENYDCCAFLDEYLSA